MGSAMNASCRLATGLLALMGLTACGINPRAGLPPETVKINGELVPNLTSFQVILDTQENPNATLPKRWDNSNGLIVREGMSFAWRCGYPVKIELGHRTAYGRLILFNRLEDAETTAGHGNYVIDVGPSVFDQITDGRRFVQFEQYRSGSFPTKAARRPIRTSTAP